MDTNIFRNWITDSNILEKTITAFEECLDYYIKNNQNEIEKIFGSNFKKDKIEYQIKNISFVLMDWDFKFEETIETKLILLFNKNEIGYYMSVYNLNAEIIDDYLVFD